MKKLIPATLAVAAFLALTPAFAEDAAAPAAAATTEAAAPAADAAADAAAVTVTEYTLKDGTTKVVVEGDKVFVVGADGAKTAAPDGDHETTTEGVTLKVKDGMLVKEEAAKEEAAKEAAPATDAAAPANEE